MPHVRRKNTIGIQIQLYIHFWFESATKNYKYVINVIVRLQSR